MKPSFEFSSPNQVRALMDLLRRYSRLPFSDGIPGSVMEGALAYVRGAEVLHTYDFVDVIKPSSRIGWQVKSTKASTPVTWKRAKLPDAEKLIRASKKSGKGLQAVGDAIICYCNDHAIESLKKYDLDAIGFSRLIVNKDNTATYYEKLLCTKAKPLIFNAADFSWKWSDQKKTLKKEQLSALHGTHLPSGKKWFAWHGQGENQLHFSGEKYWWPPHAITFPLPAETERLSMEEFVEMLAVLRSPS